MCMNKIIKIIQASQILYKKINERSLKKTTNWRSNVEEKLHDERAKLEILEKKYKDVQLNCDELDKYKKLLKNNRVKINDKEGILKVKEILIQNIRVKK